MPTESRLLVGFKAVEPVASGPWGATETSEKAWAWLVAFWELRFGEREPVLDRKGERIFFFNPRWKS